MYVCVGFFWIFRGDEDRKFEEGSWLLVSLKQLCLCVGEVRKKYVREKRGKKASAAAMRNRNEFEGNEGRRNIYCR